MIFNRNLHVAVLVAAMVASNVWASSVTSNDVIGAVSAWSSANGKTFASTGSAVSATPVYDDSGTTNLYWIVRMSNGGAVIASPDSDLDLVVAVIEKFDGSFPEGHPLPSILKLDMSNRLSVLAQRSSSATPRRRAASTLATTHSATQGTSGQEPTALDSAVAAANAQWAKYGVGSAGGKRLLGDTLSEGDASPYVRRIVDGFEAGGRFTHWNQSDVDRNPCYNKYTPENAVCGCVATAGAAILQFFNCTNDVGVVVGNPTYGKDQKPAGQYSNAYGPCDRTIAGALDWSILPKKSYGGAKEGTDVLDDAGADLLGRVTFNMGVLVDMHWDLMGPKTASGSLVSLLPAAFKEYGFKTARYIQYSADPKTDGKEFFKTIYAQLWCGAPVVLGIEKSTGGAGHAVVACGYARDTDGDEFCRVFMGWAGKDDAWYKLPVIKDFDIVDGAATMLGYQDKAVVPVYGESSMPGVELTLPGYLTNGVPVTVPVNENGFFGIRVPADITEQTIAYEPRGWTYTFSPWDADVLTDEYALREDLDAAIPDEIPAFLLHATMKPTVASGRAVAERDGKALLVVSGIPGTERTKALMEYIYWLDDTTDFSNKFVLVFNNVKSSDNNRPDGNPSIGVFDPVGFEVTDRWMESNNRLAYNDFIDGEASAELFLDEDPSEDGETLVYIFSATNTVNMTNCVTDVLSDSYDSYLRRNSGISVSVRGVNAATGTNAYEVAAVEPKFGEHANEWTNGEVVVFSAPGAVTNGDTIISCVGWTTNAPFARDMWTGEWELQPYNSGDQVELQLFSGDEFTLTWIWDVTHYRVTAVADGYENVDGQVTPSESWVRAGGRATVVAKAETEDGDAFGEWELYTAGDVDYIGKYGENDVLPYRNGTAISFFVYEPVKITAIYGSGDVPSEPVQWSYTLNASPAEMQDELPPPMGSMGSLVWGENTSYDYIVALSPGAERYIDSSGGVWVCTGWKVNDVPTSKTEIMTIASGTITCVWTLQVKPAITSIVKESDGSWTITVSNAVKDLWYWLYSTKDLSKFAGDEATWTSAADKAVLIDGDNPRQATEDGDVVFHAAGDGPAMFWRARATTTEDGGK